MPRSSTELPSTLEDAPDKAKRTFLKTHDSAVEQYGEGERAHRTAFAALKQNFEKRGGRWAWKRHGKGPSDPRSKKSTAQKRRGEGETFGGVDYEGSTRQELYERARRLDISGRSKMNKKELARAIAKAQ
jgi:hypothetical protein